MPQRSGRVAELQEMIGSLWVRGTTGPTTPLNAIQIFQQQSRTWKFGEAVGFQHLANTTMETWMQAGSTGYDPFGDNSYQSGCFNCHNLPTSTFGDDLSHYVDEAAARDVAEAVEGAPAGGFAAVVTEQPMPDSVAMPVRTSAPANRRSKPAQKPH